MGGGSLVILGRRCGTEKVPQASGVRLGLLEEKKQRSKEEKNQERV